MFSFKHFKLSDINSSLTPLNLLYEIFKNTLNPSLTQREFKSYYFSQYPNQMDITLMYNEGELVGFYSAAFYPRKIKGKNIIICRTAVGLLKNQVRGFFPLGKLFARYIQYKMNNPFTPLYITGFMASPIMYAMICKYTRTVYPRRNTAVPPVVAAFKQDLLEAMGLSKKETSPFVLKIHFQVQFSAADIQRFETSSNEDVKYYLSINPDYCKQTGVMVLLPVTYGNMLYTCCKHLQSAGRKKIRQLLQR